MKGSEKLKEYLDNYKGKTEYLDLYISNLVNSILKGTGLIKGFNDKDTWEIQFLFRESIINRSGKTYIPALEVESEEFMSLLKDLSNANIGISIGDITTTVKGDSRRYAVDSGEKLLDSNSKKLNTNAHIKRIAPHQYDVKYVVVPVRYNKDIDVSKVIDVIKKNRDKEIKKSLDLLRKDLSK